MRCIPPGGIPDDLISLNQLWTCTRAKDCQDHYQDVPLEELECKPISGDGCSSECKFEYCGDGIVQPLRPKYPEDCDPGKYCHYKKTTPWTVLPEHPCQDSGDCYHLGGPLEHYCKTVSKDGCTEECKWKTRDHICGNGEVEQGANFYEECDEGGICVILGKSQAEEGATGDECVPQIDSCPVGYSCEPRETENCIECTERICGNGELEPGEQCDDHNTEDGDGCSSQCKGELECCICMYEEETRCSNLNKLSFADIQDPSQVCTGCEYLNPETAVSSHENACKRLRVPKSPDNLKLECGWNPKEKKCISTHKQDCNEWLDKKEQSTCQVSELMDEVSSLEFYDFSLCKNPLKIERFGHANSSHCLEITKYTTRCLTCVAGACEVVIGYNGCLTYSVAETIKTMIEQVQFAMIPGDVALLTAHTASTSNLCSAPLTVRVTKYEYDFVFSSCKEVGYPPLNLCHVQEDFAYCLDKPGDSKPTKMYCCPMEEPIKDWEYKFRKEPC